MSTVRLIVEAIGWLTLAGMAAIPVLWLLIFCGVIKPLGQQ